MFQFSDCLIIKKRFFFILLGVVIQSTFFSQENNYWNNQYGAKSTLLCGAAVATYFDNGAIFYNPATLCFKDSGNISLSANLYEVELLRRDNALGEGLSLQGVNFNFSPQIVSGNRKIGDKAEIEFILMSRSDIQFNQSASYNNLFTDSVGDKAVTALHVGSYSFRKRLLDEWGGVSMSFQLGKKMGIGIGSFVSYRFLRYQMSMNTSAIGLDNNYQTVAKSDSLLNYFTNNASWVMKVGWVYHGEKNNLGLTVTSPSVHLWGKGRMEYSVFYTDQFGISVPFSNVFLNRQNLVSNYKYPFSIALGYSRSFKKSRFHFSGEYFSKINPYLTIAMKNRDFSINQSDVIIGGEYVEGLEEAKKEVFNVALAYEYYLKGTTELLLGFCTDFNSSKRNWENISKVSYNLQQDNFDLYHLSVGIGFQHHQNNIAVGLSFSTADERSNSLANFQKPTYQSKLFGNQVYEARTLYRSLGVVVGLTY